MPDTIDLSSGQVVEPWPDAVVTAVTDAAAAPDASRYAPVAGDPALRAAVAQHYARRLRRSADPDRVTVAAGARHGLFCAVAATAAGGAVLVPRPHWSHYPELIRLAGARSVAVPGAPARGWSVDPDLLDAALTPDTRAVLLNSPVNPTGAVYDAAAITGIRDWAADRGVHLVLDDVYWAYGAAAAGVPADDGATVVGGIAKVHAMAGARIGWVWAGAAVTEAVRRIAEHTTGPVSVLAQAAGRAVLAGGGGLDDPAVARRLAWMAGCRAHAVRALSGVPSLRVVPPSGGIYLCLDARDLAALHPEWTDDRRLCADLAEHTGVRLRAGSTFGLPGHLRLCVAVEPGVIDRAAAALTRFLAAEALGNATAAR
ncbi:pyridoxal phosphate-dependent aminotransferase [Actinokineospora auranticolor]|uniref:Aminotransferase n=1 Tax=Actinokineospora auranticolor TaxID=155976 RepID=A0A2S6GPJ2_9PSEU|nr:pyridoxal phosphate-dependent aminotransferase [Actinokineospora auranticolor]PPK67172.1 aspartate/methionine/tyrosine aminotransferase [Actinokineospora auranticolor]